MGVDRGAFNRGARFEVVRRALSMLGEAAQVVRDGDGNGVALVVPSNHPNYARVMRLFGCESPEVLARQERVRCFLASEFLEGRGPLATRVFVEVDVLYTLFGLWCAREGHVCFDRGALVRAVKGLGYGVHAGRVRGLVLKCHALKEGLLCEDI